MAADKTTIWTGATSGDYSVAGNWSNGVPTSGDVNGDTAIIPSGVTRSITGGDYSAAHLAAFIVQPGCTVSIGTLALPLKIYATTVRVMGSGAVYLDGGTLTTVVSSCRTLTIGANATVTTLDSLDGSVTTVLPAVATINAYGGTIIFGTPYITTAAAGVLSIFSGASVVYNSVGTVTTTHIYNGGTLDLSGDLRPVTFTSLTQDAGGKIIESMQRLVMTNWYRPEGGTLVIQ
jgi:hypothetical protein